MHLRCGQGHDLFLLAPPSCREIATDVKARLEGYFQTITVSPVEYEPGQWPQGANLLFCHAAQAMARHNPNIPWQLCEIDCLPIRSNAFDLIAARYATCGSPFMGFISKTPHRDASGKIVPSPEGPSDVMMSGNAVYPGNLPMRQTCQPMLADFMNLAGQPEQPWDIYLRHAMRREGIAHTDLISNNWNTEGYRIEGGKLFCVACKQHQAYGGNAGNRQLLDYGGEVDPHAVMVHGCKDQTLPNLILTDKIPGNEPKIEVSRANLAATAAEKQEISDLKAQIAELQRMMVAIKVDAAPKASEMVVESGEIDTETPEPTDLPEETPQKEWVKFKKREREVNTEKLRKLIAETGGRAIRLSAAARLMFFKPAELEEKLKEIAEFKVDGPEESRVITLVEVAV